LAWQQENLAVLTGNQVNETSSEKMKGQGANAKCESGAAGKGCCSAKAKAGKKCCSGGK
jgi:hypothetical protein